MEEIDLGRDDPELLHRIWLEASKRQNDWCCDVRRLLAERRISHTTYARRTGQSASRFDRVLHGAAILRLEDTAAFDLFKNHDL
jgi:hypothetical protein